MGENLLIHSKRYRQFVTDRDRALERIHQHAQMDIAQHMKDFFKHIEMVVSYLSLKNTHTLDKFQQISQEFEFNMMILLKMMFPAILGRIHRMRHAVYVLTYASEIEAIGQAMAKPAVGSIAGLELSYAVQGQTLLGQDLDKRVWANLMTLRMRIFQAFNLALVQELTSPEILKKVIDSFPKLQVYSRAPKVLKPLKEAKYELDDEDKIDFTTTIMNDSDWDLAVNAYKDSELPASRFEPGAPFDPDSGTFKYNWEIEQDLTDDFVKQVRDGQVAAARDLGIQEFVWIAILDDKTDECCRKRHGHTTSEIEEMMSSGELDTDTCDSSVPPAHPNCRCQIGPVASTDEVEGADFKDFGEWLNS